jgi:phosphoglucosamine mutase
MGKQLFGTDGIRGVAGEYPLDPATVHAFGMALGSDARRQDSNPEVLIGTDTRESGRWIAEQVAGGLRRRDVRARFAGVITTPGVACLTRADAFVAGVMISASHNPYQDNGIKVFGHSGFKLPDEEEHAIEQEIFRLAENGVDPVPQPLAIDPGLDRRYLDYLAGTVAGSFAGLRAVIDCGNGAASELAPALLRSLGAEVEAICCEPNGRNINLDCGALHIGALRAAVLDRQADLGMAFDGDADRAILVAGSGKIVDGDAVLFLCARALKAAGRLAKNLVVATVMSNLGLEKGLQREGIGLLRTPVGDKYVLEEMVRAGAVLGGEQSGHVIYREFATTGDGLLTALRVLELVRQSGAGLDELTADLEIYPQRLVNVRVREKKALADLPPVAEEIRRAEETLAGCGRVLVRFSGTEALARVMVEGPDLRQVDDLTARIAGAIQREIGA